MWRRTVCSSKNLDQNRKEVLQEMTEMASHINVKVNPEVG